jgi:hypothetical protein
MDLALASARIKYVINLSGLDFTMLCARLGKTSGKLHKYIQGQYYGGSGGTLIFWEIPRLCRGSV